VSLSTRLKTVEVTRKRLCKLGSLINGKFMSEEDKKELLEVLSVRLGEPNRIPNTILTKLLNEEGYEMGISTLERHREQMCCCYKTRTKQ